MVRGPSLARVLALTLLVTACTTSPGGPTGGPSPPETASSPGDQGGTVQAGSLARRICSTPRELLVRIWNGHRADRGPEIQMVPTEPNFVGSGLPHVGPHDYIQRVPMLLFGPGYIAPVGPVRRPVTVADIAATQARLLDFEFEAPDGVPMAEALVPASERPVAPRLIVTMVWDAGGRDVLSAWPNDWPYLRSLIPRGTWYENATVGSSPSSTAQIHTTIGTGAFPRVHGLVGHRLRIGDRTTTPWASGPAFIVRPTLADLYDRAMGNGPLVGLVGTVSIHLGMLGHGAMWGGGDRDLVILREKLDATTLGAEGFEWNLPSKLEPFYEFPEYANEVPGFERDVRAIDQADSKLDGKWRSNSIDQLLLGFDTPARIPYQNRVVQDLVTREEFGADDVPDLLYLNFKEIDYISHIWTMNSPEMKDAVVWQDAALQEFVRFLDREVGERRWVLVLTADHGALPDPELSGGFQISTGAVARAIEARFGDSDGTGVVDLMQLTGIYMNTGELRENGYTLMDVAEFLMTLTKGETGEAGTVVPAGEEDDKVFSLAFPSSIMRALPCLPEARP